MKLVFITCANRRFLCQQPQLLAHWYFFFSILGFNNISLYLGTSHPAMSEIKVGILTVSDRCSRGEAEDTAGANLKDLVAKNSLFRGQVHTRSMDTVDVMTVSPYPCHIVPIPFCVVL